MHADTYIPRRLDDQWKIGFWDVDVAAPLLFGLFMGYMSGSKLSFGLCLAAGIFLTSRCHRPHQGRQAPGLRDALAVLASAHQPG